MFLNRKKLKRKYTFHEKSIRRMRTVSLFEPKQKYSISELNTLCHEKIDELLSDPKIYIILSENFSFAVRYLQTRKFRNCTIYHTGDDQPKRFQNFKHKGGFTSLIELEESLKQDSQEQIIFG